jgi:hypothetical protein
MEQYHPKAKKCDLHLMNRPHRWTNHPYCDIRCLSRQRLPRLLIWIQRVPSPDSVGLDPLQAVGGEWIFLGLIRRLASTVHAVREWEFFCGRSENKHDQQVD